MAAMAISPLSFLFLLANKVINANASRGSKGMR